MAGYHPHNNVVNDQIPNSGPVIHQQPHGGPQHLAAEPAVATQQSSNRAPRLPEFDEKANNNNNTHSSSSNHSHPSSDETRAGTAQMEYGKSESAPDQSNQEYSNLLQYITDSANKRHAGGDEETGGNRTEHRRVWYAPWKKNKVTIDKDGNIVNTSGAIKTPESW